MRPLTGGHIVSQYLDIKNEEYKSFKSQIQDQINEARLETRELYAQLEQIKIKKRDNDLCHMAKDIPNLAKGRFNIKPLNVLKGHKNKIADFSWSQNSKKIISASQDGYIIIWDSETGLKKNAIPLESKWVLSSALSPTGKLAASAGLNNNCTIYRVPTTEPINQHIVAIFKGHTGYISGVEFIDEPQVVTSSGDMTCALWDINKSKRIREYSNHLGDVLALTVPKPVSGKTDTFASCGSDGYTYFWDTRSAAAIQHFAINERDVNCIQYFKDQNSIAIGNDEGTVVLFDMRADCPIASYSVNDPNSSRQKEHTFISSTELKWGSSSSSSPRTPISLFSHCFEDRGVVSLDFSISGRLMYACYINLGCIIWDTLKGEVVGTLEDQGQKFSGVRTSPDGLAICTGSWDQYLKLWSPKYMS
ncbi:Guanine nucleotide-binding protein subunit beta [Nakaseomyces bracarensis]|uniref:Guanine nucleotide-binding protein subunit beta n=1 Tax=Nakaseomyces bracarensis TaxID=273131 RepID=A0ABR4NXK8_9SACH